MPSEVSKPVRPATPIKSTAKTTPVATAKITKDEKQGNIPEAVGRSNRSISEVAISPSMKKGVNQPSLLSVKPVDAAPKTKVYASPNEQGQKTAPKAVTPEAPKINYGGNDNQRANLPSEVNKPAQPAMPVAPKAVTPKAVTPKAVAPKPVNPQDPKLLSEMGIGVDTSKPAAPKAAAPVANTEPKATGLQEFADPTERAKFMLKEYQNTPAEDRPGFDESSYDKKAVSSKDSIMPTVSDKYRNDEVSYNQAYWKAKLDGKTSQADMAAEQKALGSKKIYSGDRAITEQDQSVAKQIELYLKDSGIKPTVENMKKGLFGETMLTNSSYDIGTGKNILTSKETTSPTILGFRVGDDVTKSSVNGVNTYVKTGQGDTQKTESAKLSASNDRVEAGPDPVAEMKDIDNQIKNETDPVKLKALYQRRLRLMRMNRTNTRFAGLIGEADTKRTNLMSIS